ncbi:conserved hypothetical protein [Thermosulfidibacter takaii ABI70S6]|uniref:Lipoprotein n=1 Tax=Thermosulfidibacter takaii (strain DSM 17441 / JCM 13301 / NBRC 103674 / ABI70S6) TaxID=1298851 RepID=A0A0S3QTW0_THET7|nr:hypothetical protein [Thermosulfidibacter takaii]BAT71778.1 conserved hypothetical protein [Thermosulfidibacter takaii ABI70S6]
MRRLISFLIIFLLAIGCATTQHKTTTKKNTPKIVQIQKVLENIPIFPGAKFDLDNTFIYESGTIKAAVITLEGSGNLKDAVDFYKRKMLEEGWELVSSFIYQQKASLFFDSPASSCNIEIEQDYGKLTIIIRTGTKAPLGDVK